MGIAQEVARRSTCYRRFFGTIVVKDDQIISTGYVGAPRKTKDCLEHGNCLRDKLNIPHGQRYEICRSVHSEQNAIINSARAGVSLLDATVYLYGEDPKTGKAIEAFPCFICKKMIINSGVATVICSTDKGKVKKYKVSTWANEWHKNDIIDDKTQYGKKENKKATKRKTKKRKK